ncbi:MAG: protein phosphatase [Cyanobium sp.]
MVRFWVPDAVSPPGDSPDLQTHPWQARVVDLAIAELVRQHRESFPPLWTVESWAKLLIWLALSCGCATDRASLEQFAAALGPSLSARMRRVFFERELEDLQLRLLADPAESQVLALPTDPLAGAPDTRLVLEALGRVGLSDRVAAVEGWQRQEALIALPWRPEAPCN